MTKYRKSTLFIICTFCTVVAFCQTSKWKEYVYAEDGFAISSPLEPRMEKRKSPLEARWKRTFITFPRPV